MVEYKVEKIVRPDTFGNKVVVEYPSKEERKIKNKSKKNLKKITYKSNNPLRKLLKSKRSRIKIMVQKNETINLWK